MGPLSNGTTLWLGIEPADIFLYVFLPPLLLDSTVRTDYFTFKKVISPIVSSRSWSQKIRCTVDLTMWRAHGSATRQFVLTSSFLFVYFPGCLSVARRHPDMYMVTVLVISGILFMQAPFDRTISIIVCTLHVRFGGAVGLTSNMRLRVASGYDSSAHIRLPGGGVVHVDDDPGHAVRTGPEV